MVFSYFLAEWTSYIIMPIIIIGNNIRVDIIGVSRAHATKQIDEKSAQNCAKMPWKWSDFESVLHDLCGLTKVIGHPLLSIHDKKNKDLALCMSKDYYPVVMSFVYCLLSCCHDYYPVVMTIILLSWLLCCCHDYYAVVMS